MKQVHSPYGKVDEAWLDEMVNVELFYKMFSGRDADAAFFVDDFTWPSLQTVMARATRIGYWSDKFTPDNPKGEWTPYTHVHKAPLPRVIRQWIPGDRLLKNPVFPPHVPVIPWLGFCLDLEVRMPNGKYHTFDWIETYGYNNLPLLGWLEEKKCLVIQSVYPNELPLLVQSPILKVTERGIIN